MARLSRHNITLRVKRRLFGDDGDCSDKNLNRCDNEFRSNPQNNCEVLTHESHSLLNKTGEKLENILVISSFPSSNVMNSFREHAATTHPSLGICYCAPEDAYLQCKKLLYTIIFTDINLSENNEMLRLIVSIRKTNNFNQLTPIVAICQTHHHHVKDLCSYGVDEVYRGTIEENILQTILLKYIKTDNKNAFGQLQEKDLIPSSSSDKKTTIDVTDVISASTTTNQPSSCADIKPVSFTNKCIPQIASKKILKPIMQRPVLPKTIINMAPSFLTPALSVAAMRRCSVFPSISTHVVDTPLTYPYVANTTELKAGDLKHSTKERLRRERIKVCCDQMRVLLPKLNRKKVDMASVFEFAVLYIKIMQAHSPSSITEKCASIFKIVSKKDGTKRKYSGVFGEGNLPSKEMRRSGTNVDQNCLSRAHNQIADPTSKISQCSILQNQPQQLACKYSNEHDQVNNGIPLTLSRSVPSHYSPIDYFNYGFDNFSMYPNDMNHQMSHNENAYLKEPALLNDVPLNIPVEYNQFHAYYPYYS